MNHPEKKLQFIHSVNGDGSKTAKIIISTITVRDARDEETKTGKRQRKKRNSGKLGIRQDHARRGIEMKFCVVGGLYTVVLRFEFHQDVWQ